MMPIIDKKQLRAAMRQQRQDYSGALDNATRASLENQLADALEPLFAGATVIAAYAPMKDEISPLPAMTRANAARLELTFPYFVDRDSRMTFRAGAPVERGPWGILQPASDAAIASPDLILMPLVAIDPSGNRVGMGKGHYDRTLPGLRAAGARLIGCGWAFQRIEHVLVPDPWDVALDGFASPDGLEMFG